MIEDNKTLNDFLPRSVDINENNFFYAKKTSNITKNEKLQKEHIINVLEEIYDPEIPVNIYELGLVYDIKIFDNCMVEIKMSLTSPGCPVAGEMPQNVADKVCLLHNVKSVKVELVWDPPWTTDRMSDDAKLALDFG